jgi:hypothetical protein
VFTVLASLFGPPTREEQIAEAITPYVFLIGLPFTLWLYYKLFKAAVGNPAIREAGTSVLVHWIKKLMK